MIFCNLFCDWLNNFYVIFNDIFKIKNKFLNSCAES